MRLATGLAAPAQSVNPADSGALQTAGTLAVDAIPFAATRPDQVVPLLLSEGASVGAYASGPVWSASVASGILPAVGPAAGATDALVRLRFCPTAVEAQATAAAEGATSPPPNPFGPSASEAAGQRLRLSLGSGNDSPGASAAGDGAQGGPSCDAPVAVTACAGSAQCAAARRLLQCSESLVLLTELKDARLAPANVTAAVQRAFGSSGSSSSGDSDGGFQVRLNSDAPALFVSLEAEQQAGRFNSSAMLLLPWEPQTVAFLPVPQGHPYAAEVPQEQQSAGPSAAPPQAESLSARQAAPPTAEGGHSAAPEVSVLWLQHALAELQPGSGAAADAASAGGRATSVGGVHILLLSLALSCALLALAW